MFQKNKRIFIQSPRKKLFEQYRSRVGLTFIIDIFPMNSQALFISEIQFSYSFYPITIFLC